MAAVSPDVQWMCIRKTSCFLHRARNVHKNFSREPMNLAGVNSFRYNGLINRRALGVQAAADGKGVVLLTKKARNQHKPAHSVQTTLLKRNSRHALTTIAKVLKAGAYRPTLSKMALRRASQILRSQKPKAAKKKRGAKKPKAE